MSKRSMMRGDDAFLRAQAIKQARWAKATDPAPKDGIANVTPVQLPPGFDHYVAAVAALPPGSVAERVWVDGHELFPAATPRKRHPARSDTARPYFALLMGLLRPHGIPEPKCELLFDPVRKWRFDFAWPHFWLAVEISGGNWIEGRHVRPAALLEEYAKMNAAQMQGWTVLTFTPQQLTQAADAIRSVLGTRIGAGHWP